MAALAQADFSPIINSISSQRNAKSVEYAAREIGFDRRRFESNRRSFELAEKQLNLQMDMADLQKRVAERNITFSWINLGLSAAQGALNVGAAIYQYKAAADQQTAKLELTNMNSEAEAAAYNAVRNGSFKMIDSGNGVMTMPTTIEGLDSIVADYQNRFDKTLSTRAGKAMAAQGMAEIKAGAFSYARAQAFSESQKEFEAGFAQNKLSAVQSDIAASGLAGPGYDFTNSLMDTTSGVLGPERSKIERNAIERAVTLGWLNKYAAGIAETDGPENAGTWVEHQSEELAKQGRAISSEEKDELKKAITGADEKESQRVIMAIEEQFTKAKEMVKSDGSKYRPNELYEFAINGIGQIREKDRAAVEARGHTLQDVQAVDNNLEMLSQAEYQNNTQIRGKILEGLTNTNGLGYNDVYDSKVRIAIQDLWRDKKKDKDDYNYSDIQHKIEGLWTQNLTDVGNGVQSAYEARSTYLEQVHETLRKAGADPVAFAKVINESGFLMSAFDYIDASAGATTGSGKDAQGRFKQAKGSIESMVDEWITTKKIKPEQKADLVGLLDQSLLDIIYQERIGGRGGVTYDDIAEKFSSLAGQLMNKEIEFLGENARGRNNLITLANNLEILEKPENENVFNVSELSNQGETIYFAPGVTGAGINRHKEQVLKTVSDATGFSMDDVRAGAEWESEGRYKKNPELIINLPNGKTVKLKGKDGKLSLKQIDESGNETDYPKELIKDMSIFEGSPNPYARMPGQEGALRPTERIGKFPGTYYQDMRYNSINERVKELQDEISKKQAQLEKAKTPPERASLEKQIQEYQDLLIEATTGGPR
jgi:hypothetical protein